jgi:pimeloyl-ACP methyl ester carboxylesterase
MSGLIPRRPLTAALLCLLLTAALPAAAKTVTTSHQGQTLRGELRTAPDRPLGAGVVLMVHGTKGHSGMPIIRKAADAFKQRGMSTLAVTLSLGRSDRSGFMPCAGVHDHRHGDAVGEIGAWLDWLGAHGVRRVVLFGHSRGGNQVAWYAAARDDPRIRGAVMLAPMTWDAERAAARYARRFGAELAPLLERARGLAPDAVMEVPGFLHCDGPTRVTAGAFLGYYGDDRRKDTPTLVPEIDVPVFVAAGRADRRLPDLAKHLAALPEQSGRSVMLLEDSGHFFRGRLPAVVDSAARFLEQHAVFSQSGN